MRSRNLFASILTACLLAAGIGGLSPAAKAAPSVLNPGKAAGNHVTAVEYRHRHRDRRIYLPVGPSSIYFDYPYYDSRGYYPRYIGPGYAYYGNGGYVLGSGGYDEGDDDDSGYAGAPYSAKERCARRFRSFEWESGLYTTYGGQTKLCPYLR
jgi:hypothetical protein